MLTKNEFFNQLQISVVTIGLSGHLYIFYKGRSGRCSLSLYDVVLGCEFSKDISNDVDLYDFYQTIYNLSKSPVYASVQTK